MTFEVKIQDDGLRRVLDVVKPNGKAKLTEAGAYSLYVAVMRHVKAYARTHHASANRLGAQPTGHFEDGADDISYGSDGNGTASVTIPIRGFSRVFGDVTITPRSEKALTLPINSISYGRRAREMRRLGFTLFKFGKKEGGKDGVLYGYRDGDDHIEPLYALKSRVTLRQDRSMLPSDKDMTNAVQDGMMAAIRSAMRAARRSA